MEKLLKARQRMLSNSKKGFTLVELIVVIVILAILIAALVPAILGVINQANVAADQADVRAVMMAGSVRAMQLTPPRAPDINDPGAVLAEFTGEINIVPGTYIIAFDGAIAVGGILDEGSRSGQKVVVGLSESAFSGLSSPGRTPTAGATGAGANYTFMYITHPASP